jgi:hypothetical protein
LMPRWRPCMRFGSTRRSGILPRER